MAIGSVNGTAFQGAGKPAGNMQADPVSRNIQNQIANAQKKLKDLSADDKMTPEEKMKKRQEIQQEIASLQQQLRQHQIEQKREQQSKDSSMEALTGQSRKTSAAKSGSKGAGLSTSSMQAMISADSSVKQAKVQGSVATKMEGRAGVLEVEIKLDSSRGGSTEAKEEELAKARAKQLEAETSQIGTLADANRTLEEAAKTEQQTQASESDKKTEDKDSKTIQASQKEDKIPGKAAENKDNTEAVNTETVNTEAVNTEENPQDANHIADATGAVTQPMSYTRVDIRL
ncbi:MAG: FlxA-like family protein [Lachnospiraceae bacterium]|nr:FlxA-like family protein [Lachnospiraceae bacterium]